MFETRGRDNRRFLIRFRTYFGVEILDDSEITQSPVEVCEYLLRSSTIFAASHFMQFVRKYYPSRLHVVQILINRYQNYNCYSHNFLETHTSVPYQQHHDDERRLQRRCGTVKTQRDKQNEHFDDAFRVLLERSFRRTK